MTDFRGDVRQAVRAMGRQKGFTAAALVSLALGIGANTALFSVTYGVLLRPLPYDDADRLVRLSEEHPGANAPVRRLLSNLTFHAWRHSLRCSARVPGPVGSCCPTTPRRARSR